MFWINYCTSNSHLKHNRRVHELQSESCSNIMFLLNVLSPFPAFCYTMFGLDWTLGATFIFICSWWGATRRYMYECSAEHVVNHYVNGYFFLPKIRKYIFLFKLRKYFCKNWRCTFDVCVFDRCWHTQDVINFSLHLFRYTG